MNTKKEPSRISCQFDLERAGFAALKMLASGASIPLTSPLETSLSKAKGILPAETEPSLPPSSSSIPLSIFESCSARTTGSARPTSPGIPSGQKSTVSSGPLVNESPTIGSQSIEARYNKALDDYQRILDANPADKVGLPTDAKARKKIPLYSGLVKYFPDALIAVASLSQIGNDQHNPGQPLHWAREKSTDQEDTLLRHLFEAGTIDTDGVRHSTKVAWRALAALQLEIERASE